MEKEIIDKLEDIEKGLKALRSKIKKVKLKTIGKKELRLAAEFLSRQWFDSIESELDQYAIESSLVVQYHDNFEKLLKISSPNNFTTSYQLVLKDLCVNFRKDFVLSIKSLKNNKRGSFDALNKFFDAVTNKEEKEYIDDAIKCAQTGFLKAAAILAWCATIDRVNHVIEKKGFTVFNRMQVYLASQQQGRFKKFKTVKPVNSLNELRSDLFDTEILWIIEGMGLIDSNQHTRLSACYSIRCQSAHPGEAPIKEWNLVAYFSDINEIIFKNSNFKI